MIIPVAKSVSDILSSTNAQLVIPPNQRNFDWGKEEVGELIDDLQENRKEGDSGLFLGTMIFENSKNSSHMIVDGQQRLTTISVLLVACRTRAKELKNTKQSTQIQNKVTFVDDVSGDSSGTRLIASPSIRDVFEYICEDSWDGVFPNQINSKNVRRQSNKLRPVYEYIYDRIKSYKQRELDNLLRSLYSAYVIQIVISSPQEAFEIFERTNARGLELNIGDLVKNFLFANDESDEINDAWESIVANSKNTLQRMLKYFWVSRKGYSKKSDLYRSIKKYGNNVGSSALAKEIFEFSRFYWVVQSLDEKEVKDWLDEAGLKTLSQNQDYYQSVNRVFQALKFFKVTQAYPLIYSLFVSYRKDKSSDHVKTKALLKTLNNLEKYHFVNNVICERVGNEVERFYSDYSALFSDKGTIEDLKSFNKELVSKLAGRDEFVGRFADINYVPTSPPLLHYVFDRINNFAHKGSQRVDLYLPSKDFIKTNFNRDHILPQQLKNDPAVSQVTKDAIDNIGNILVISRHSNSEFQHAMPAQKIPVLKEAKHSGKFSYIKDFVERYSSRADEWSEVEIYARAKNLAEDGYDRVWKLEIW